MKKLKRSSYRELTPTQEFNQLKQDCRDLLDSIKWCGENKLSPKDDTLELTTTRKEMRDMTREYSLFRKRFPVVPVSKLKIGEKYYTFEALHGNVNSDFGTIRTAVLTDIKSVKQVNKYSATHVLAFKVGRTEHTHHVDERKYTALHRIF